MVVELTHTSLPKWPPVAVVTGLGLGAAPFESPDGPCPWLYHMPIMKYVCVGGRGGGEGYSYSSTETLHSSLGSAKTDHVKVFTSMHGMRQ